MEKAFVLPVATLRVPEDQGDNKHFMVFLHRSPVLLDRLRLPRDSSPHHQLRLASRVASLPGVCYIFAWITLTIKLSKGYQTHTSRQGYITTENTLTERDGMKFKGINHLAMVTADMEATIRFWRDLMGMRLIHGYGEVDFRQYFFEIDKRSCLSFFEWEGAEPVERKLHGQPFSGPLVFDHLAFGLDSKEEVWALKDKLEAAGFACSDMIDHDFIQSVYSFDPNGIPIEFCYEVKGREIRRNPAVNDSNPPLAALEGAEPQPGMWPEVTKPTPQEEQEVKSGDGSGFFKK